MVAQDFFDLLKKLNPRKGGGIEDFSDRLNCRFTVLMLVLCSSVVTIKQYVFKPISCYLSTPNGGTNVVSYMENYCWIHGTVSIGVDEIMPHKPADWAKLEVDRMYYYQWIPFVLGLQALMFYAPRALWQVVTSSASGVNVSHVMTTACEANHKQQNDREKLIKHVARSLEQMLIHYREYRQGTYSKVKLGCHKLCFGFVLSKRLGTWLVLWYIFVKILYFINSFGQIYLMQTFLGFHSKYDFFGYDLLSDIIKGRTWQQTMIFPRVTFCYVQLRALGHTPGIVAQCVLPVNMLNEKIYIFLWFWIVICGLFTGISIPMWLFRVACSKQNQRFIRKYLKLTDIYSPREKPIVRKFETRFLRHDGLFLLRMLSLNAGDLVTSDVVVELWTTFRDGYRDRDFRDDGIGEAQKNTFQLDSPQHGSGVCRPTAPDDSVVAPSYDEYKKFLPNEV